MIENHNYHNNACRSYLSKWQNKQGEEINAGRMNLGVVTLNLVRIALESNTAKDIT